jgi:uncharacterized membrane protein
MTAVGAPMKPDRLNAFTDGVIAIIITIMVLSLPVPTGTDLNALHPDMPVFGAYVLSFIYVGIYWNNHHHMMQTAKKVNGGVLWANLFLLFWLSLLPFLIRWIGEAGLSPLPLAALGLVLFFAGLAYFLLERTLIAAEGEQSVIATAVGSKTKEWMSVALYAAGIALAFVSPWLSVGMYILVAALWLVPDRRFEQRLQP